MEEKKQKNWFGRNWLWVLPVGGCLTVILLFVFGIGAAIFGVSKIVKNSEPYEHAVSLAKSNDRVMNALGAPIDTYGIFKGNISIENNRGEADLKIPIEGKNGEGTIVVLAEKANGTWDYDSLYVLVKDSQEKIQLQPKLLEVD
ncbi:MAG: hypothetical protein GYB32_00045 [Algicola sp.]|nr:hypothetical protein [Algicola sp.]